MITVPPGTTHQTAAQPAHTLLTVSAETLPQVLTLKAPRSATRDVR
ncbi:hypothetical protein I553_6208 [Mycobacterium xenopi 4042]|uniref:Cupin domain protein n=1 Tax=Mycobacterium xenopi 4042 TaxID=1299334 RepID=X8BGL1_MYCXE|nr:hypothetical protein I553_6208 [Mycobacterium xenopi 4042]